MKLFFKIVGAATLLLTGMVILAVLLDEGPAGGRLQASGDFEQLGYLKLSNRTRIFTIRYPDGKDRDAIRAHAEGLAHTGGRVTAAYYYPNGARAPADGVTLAGSWEAAQNVLWSAPAVDGWDYVFFRYPKGAPAFVDCREGRSGDLCRK